MVRGKRLALLVALALLPLATPARADAIDGNWCYTDGRRMSIEGPAITTPAGTPTTGDYHRHFFSYVIPTRDPGAGETVFMTLLNENSVNIIQGADAQSAAKKSPETWHRCPPSVSALPGAPDPS